MKNCFYVRFPAAVAATLLFVLSGFAAPVHPLDPLDKAEIADAVKIAKTAPQFPKIALFSTVQLNEPPKTEVMAFKAGAKFRREAFIIVFDRLKNKTYEAVVDLNAKQIQS